jgi:hypothetical protein
MSSSEFSVMPPLVSGIVTVAQLFPRLAER